MLAKSKEEHTEELADVLEVIHALSKAYGISFEQIEQKRMEKKELKGGFELRLYGSHVEVDPDHSSLDYYRKRLEQYPENP
jgi:hypothetical protein